MKVQRKYLQLACLNLFLVMSVILCPHQTYAKGKKFKIYFTNAEKSIKLPLKSSQPLSVRYSKKKKASYKIKWESSNPRVVKVSKKGILTPKKTGKSVIRHVVRTKSGKVIAKKSIKVKVTPEIAIKAISCEEDAASETLIKYPNKYRWNVSLKPANASLASVTFQSSDKSIATISKSGVITPLKEGNITMTAKYKKVILKRRFHVTIPLKKLTTRHQKISMPYGTSRTLSVNFKPWNASDKKLTWSTNNDTVAVVDENGHVTTRGVGVAVITATSIKNPSRKCNITITVTAENGLLSTEDLDDFDLKDGDRLMIIAHPDDGAEGGNEVEGESHDAPQQRKVHVHVIAKQESQKPCNCADEGFNNEIFLDSGQGLGEFADACVAVMPQFIDVRPEAGGFPQEESHQDQNQGGEGQHGS